MVSDKTKEKIGEGVKVNLEKRIACEWAEWRYAIVMRFDGIRY